MDWVCCVEVDAEKAGKMVKLDIDKMGDFGVGDEAPKGRKGGDETPWWPQGQKWIRMLQKAC